MFKNKIDKYLVKAGFSGRNVMLRSVSDRIDVPS